MDVKILVILVRFALKRRCLNDGLRATEFLEEVRIGRPQVQDSSHLLLNLLLNLWVR